MADLIAFLIEHFQDFDACPAPHDLGVLLEEVGFDGEEIDCALMLLGMLAAQPANNAALHHADSLRVYSVEEMEHLPQEVLGLLHFLEKEQALNVVQREFVMHALLCMPSEDVSVDMAKVLSLLVLWAQNAELPVLIGDELLVALHGMSTMQ